MVMIISIVFACIPQKKPHSAEKIDYLDNMRGTMPG